jgi:arylsulfatase A-like enzyme
MNVVILTARGLQASALGCYGNALAATPTLDGLAAQGVVFDRHYADATDPAGVRRAWRDGRFHLPDPESAAEPADGDDLIARLKQQGVFTCLIVDDSRPAPAAFEEGWDEVNRAACFETAVETARDRLPELRRMDSWLLWVDFGAPLPPWDPPEEFGAMHFDVTRPDDEEGDDQPAAEPLTPLTDVKEGEGEVEGEGDANDETLFLRMTRSYAAAVTYLDDGIGRILGSLSEEETEPVIVFTSDRGVALGEHGAVGGTRPHAEVVHVPLIVRLPGGEEAGRRVDSLSQAVDLAATLADVFEVELPSAHGGSLLPLVYGEAESVRPYACSGGGVGPAAEWSIRTLQWAYMSAADPSVPPRLYVQPDDLHEVNDVRHHHQEWPEALQRTLRAILRACRAPGPFVPPTPPVIDAVPSEPTMG